MLKKILIISSIVIVLLIAALIALPFIFKDKLITIAKVELNKQLNAQVDFKGIGLSVFRDFPHLTLTLKELTVVNIEPFKGDTLASIKSFSTAVNIMSLIRGNTIDVIGITIDNPRLKVRVLKDGTANYDIMKPIKKESSEFEVKMNSIKINNADIRYDDRQSDMRALIENLNFRGNGDFTKDIFDFKTVTKVDKATVTSGGISYLNKTELELKLDLGIDLPNSTYTLKDNSLRLNALVLGVDGWVSDRTPGHYSMDLKFNAKETSFKNLLSLVPAIYMKDFGKVKTDGNLALSGFAKGVYKDESYPEFGVSVKVDNAMFQYPDLPAAVTGIFFDMKVAHPGGDLDKMTIDIPKLDLKVGGEPIAMKLHVKTPISDPDLDVQAKGKINLANVKQFYPLEPGEEMAGNVAVDATMKGRMSALEKEQYDKVNASGTVDISGLKYKNKEMPEGITAEKIAMVFSSKAPSTPAVSNSAIPLKGYGTLLVQNFVYTDKTLPGGKAKIDNISLTLNQGDATLERFSAQIGKSDFNTTGKLNNVLGYALSDGTLSGQLDMKSKHIDLNEFMAMETSSASSSDDEMSVVIPANLALNLSLGVTKVLYEKMEMNNVQGRASVRDETFTLTSLSTSTLGGNAIINGALNTKDQKNPKVDFGYNITNIDIRQAFNALSTIEKFAPAFKYMNGKFSSNLTMNGVLFEDFSLDMNTLLANGRVELNNAVITGFPVLKEIADRFKIKELQSININDAWTVFEFINGRIAVEPFDVKANNIIMNIGGSHGIDNSVDYNILMDIPNNMLGQAGDLVNDLIKKNPIPGFSMGNLPDLMKFRVKVTNTLQDPKMEVSLVGKGGANVREQILETVKETVDEKITEVKEEVSAQIKEQADRIIAEGKKNAQKVRDEGKQLAEKVRSEGYAQAKKLEDEAKNPIAKQVATQAARKLRQETDTRADQIIREANTKADDIEREAERQAQQVLQGGK